ncbi:MAG: proline--tRNA ligase [Pseudomonadota bacterium]
MRVSDYFLPTLKDNPSDAQIASHRLMLRAGLIRQMASGIYSWLPLGLKVLKNIENIIRSELEKSGAVEILMPTIQPADLWRESGRYDAYGPEMLRMKDRHNRDMLYGPTNEEMITDIFRGTVRSYKKLPHILYHMQWKFRDEIRPRFGVMRGREFLMKDAYSFDIDEEKARYSYQKMMVTYLRIFARLGLTAIPMRAETGPIGGDLSHEFHVLAPTGESAVYFDRAFYNIKSLYDENPEFDHIESVYKEVTKYYATADEQYDEDEFFSRVSEENRVIGRGIEIGHIFYLGTKYSSAMDAIVIAPDSQEVPVHMGCYGIGVSRMVGALIEASHDEKGIIWHKDIAPFHIGLINLRQGNEATDAACEKLYQACINAGLTVLYHDTDDRAGAKFADIDLTGLPYQLIVGPKGAEQNMAEVKIRATNEKREISVDNVVDILRGEIL